ncbi:hypothetical protein EVAR_25149_1 [Eumeta japonica]|uniref:Uncharacterized protein n=1 Tax=Eumeta variegata TaxID=151549 RepID=A0A4C1VRM0_EUMVA|nr:hypothetical protein EVAR_25149_1 [Eumeta japonica]
MNEGVCICSIIRSSSTQGISTIRSTEKFTISVFFLECLITSNKINEPLCVETSLLLFPDRIFFSCTRTANELEDEINDSSSHRINRTITYDSNPQQRASITRVDIPSRGNDSTLINLKGCQRRDSLRRKITRQAFTRVFRGDFTIPAYDLEGTPLPGRVRIQSGVFIPDCGAARTPHGKDLRLLSPVFSCRVERS